MKTSILICVLLLLACPVVFSQEGNTDNSEPSENIRTILEQSRGESQYAIKREKIALLATVESFYTQRSFEPAWFKSNKITHQLEEMMTVLKDSGFEGLDPQDYHLSFLETAITKLKDKNNFNEKRLLTLAQADVLLTDAYFQYASNMSTGRLERLDLDPQWHIEGRQKLEYIVQLNTDLTNDTVAASLIALQPVHKEYVQLKNKLKEMLVAQEKAYGKKAQELQENIAKVKINLERWRWLPQQLEDRYILVNAADFTLDVIEKDVSQLHMKVIVGKAQRETPAFSDVMTYVVFNPSWHAPRSIAIRDKLPLLKQDAAGLAKQGFQVFDEEVDDGVPISPDTIDWSTVTEENFKYRIQQLPGPTNPLGRIKFMFPNQFDIYLHDTPDRFLFEKDQRMYSSGCIRIERPLDLAEYLFKVRDEALDEGTRDEGRKDERTNIEKSKEDKTIWTLEKITAAIEAGKEQTVVLPEPIRVYILYITAWVDDNGELHFRDDIYGRDQKVDQKTLISTPKKECMYGMKCWFKNLIN
ncbi:MAG: ErfK/YbiS/YcfS/YnhG family protein [uncultured bacterium]|nr:MAG: ErfK/YbiS/YcfS/YnhG family protein [uncultured bacterium]HLD45287.1 L,D-transpeptidase family protein [bacterium]